MSYRPATLPSCTVASGWYQVCDGIPPRSVRLASDSVANDKYHTEVDDLFAEWDSDPLGLMSLPDLGM
jgi:hypothetical protein